MYSQILSKMTKSSLKRHDMAFSYEKYVATDNMSVSVMRKKDQKNFHCLNPFQKHNRQEKTMYESHV